MTGEAKIESGCVQVAAGIWLTGQAQPAVCTGVAQVRGLRGLRVPDRAHVRAATCTGAMWCAAADRPFLTRLDALPDAPLNLVSSKLLVAPFAARASARAVKLVPLSLSKALVVTQFRGGEGIPGWAIAATCGRTTRLVVEDGATLTVRPECVVAWVGPDPTGFCPKLSLLDILLPRGPRNLAFTFHAGTTLWIEGSRAMPKRGRSLFRHAC